MEVIDGQDTQPHLTGYSTEHPNSVVATPSNRTAHSNGFMSRLNSPGETDPHGKLTAVLYSHLAASQNWRTQDLQCRCLLQRLSAGRLERRPRATPHPPTRATVSIVSLSTDCVGLNGKDVDTFCIVCHDNNYHLLLSRSRQRTEPA